jgi:hypothetical protein
MNSSENEEKKYTHNEVIENYLSTLSDQEIQAFKIAEKQLESSFSLEKSIGFLEFKRIKNVYVNDY